MVGAQLFVNGLVEGLNIGLLGLAFWLVYRSVRVFHIAFSVTFALPPFVLWSALGAGLPWFLGALAAIAAGALLALGCEAVNHGRLERAGASPDLHLVASLGTASVVVQVIAMVWGNEAKFLYAGAHPRLELAGVVITRAQGLNAAVSLALAAAVVVWLHRTTLGLRLRALADNPWALSLHGHSIARLRLLVFGLSGALAAAGSLLTAFDVGFDPYVGLQALLLAVVATVIGGRGSALGPVVGGVILGLTRSLVVVFASPSWKEGVTFMLLTLFLLLRPRGLVGRRTRLEEGA